MWTRLLLGMGSGEGFCRQEGGSSQRHLQGSLLNMACRMNWAIRRAGTEIERGSQRGEKEERRGNQEAETEYTVDQEGP